MIKTTSIDLKGYGSFFIPNTFYKQEQGSQKLAVVFPGMMYTCQMPLLYYPVKLLKEKGFDVLCVDYVYFTLKKFISLDKADQMKWFFSDAESVIKKVLSEESYNDMILMGKSIGTLALAHLLEKEERMLNAKYIWLTPILQNENLRKQIIEKKPKSLFVIGTADPYFNAEYLDEVKSATQGKTVVIENAGHSMEIVGDLSSSVDAIKEVLDSNEKFLD